MELISNAGVTRQQRSACMWVTDCFLFYFSCQPKVAKLTQVKEIHGSVR